MGIVHVLAGPDHLSALATLSANIGNFQAFWYGVRWGLGHSIGLLLVGSVLVIIDFSTDDMDNDNDDEVIPISQYFESFCESIVGVFMILLGLHGLRSAHLKHRVGRDQGVEGSTSIDDIENNDGHLFSSNRNSLDDDVHLELSPSANSKNDNNLNTITEEETTPPALNVQNGEASLSLADIPLRKRKSPDLAATSNEAVLNHHHHHHHFDCCPCIDRLNFSKPILSLGIGIIHGIAGPGGVLGVIPAVQLHNWKLALVYLGTFCTSSTLVMGIYAALYGSCSAYISETNVSVMAYRMEVFSAGLSLFVGIMWLFLLSIGKLHAIFP